MPELHPFDYYYFQYSDMLVDHIWTSEYLKDVSIEKEELSNHIVGIVQPKTFENEYKIIKKELNLKIKNEESI